MPKETFREAVLGRTVDTVCFGIFSSDDISRQSHVVCQMPTFYSMTDKECKPIQAGPADPRMGTATIKSRCRTCGLDLNGCLGHFGEINLKFPCYHPGYMKKIIQILQCVCKKCGHVLMSYDEKAKWRKKLLAPTNSEQVIKNQMKSFLKKSKTIKTCAECGYRNGVVKKLNSISIIHEVIATNEAIDVDAFAEPPNKKSLTAKGVSKNRYTLIPNDVMELFYKIPKEEHILLGMRGWTCPENLIITNIAVPPVNIRPSILSNFKRGTSEDDLSVKISEIIYKNRLIDEEQNVGRFLTHSSNDYDILQCTLTMYFLGNVSGLPVRIQPQTTIRSLLQRLKGKHGRFRCHLSGKRVDFSARTVISPDPNISINQVVVPLHMAMILTFPETVNAHNIEIMRNAVLNGPDVHPGANFYQMKGSQHNRYLRFYDRAKLASGLKFGDTVERHLVDDDIVLFNRQPSLHRLSIMAHKVKVMRNKTLSFNECVCTPYNADFDGDEMNIHLPQTYEAKAEAISLMGVNQNIRTPRNGDPLIGSMQDFITGAYLITSKDRFFTHKEFMAVISSFFAYNDENTLFTCPEPVILKPYPLWTGKQVMSGIINPMYDSRYPVNLRTKGKNYTQGEESCFNDSFIIFYNGHHLFGMIDKNIIGSGSKKTIFYSILKNFGSDAVSQIMLRLNRVTAYFMAVNGFSIGINDVTASGVLCEKMEDMVKDGYELCDKYIDEFNNKKLVTRPGMTLEESLEGLIIGELSKIREASGKICINELDTSNSPLIMALCGSKGSLINISQMIACVGQQALSGKRTPDGFDGRSLPRFKPNSKSPESKGFVRNSFFHGLTPTEFYFHTMAGREGLVDTAVKTAETGYMQRRLTKVLEDLCVKYDNTVRDAANKIFQFMYGYDGLDPIEMETDSHLVDLSLLLNHIYNTTGIKSHELLPPADSVAFTTLYIDQKFKGLYKNFTDSIIEIVTKMAYGKAGGDISVGNFELTHYRFSKRILTKYIDECYRRYTRSFIEPGTTVGSLCAQSVGEPATQMTLKTFHFAGVAAMNITQGVPRLREIMNAVINISTPIIEAHMEVSNDIEYARRVKGRIEQTTLGQISSCLSLVFNDTQFYILIDIDTYRINALQLDITLDTIERAILRNSKLKVAQGQIEKYYPGKIVIYPSESKKQNAYFYMTKLRNSLKNLVIIGYKGISRAVVVVDEESKSPDTSYKLNIEGTDLLSVIGTKNIVPESVKSNNAITMCEILGVEAARQTLINEFSSTMQSHGIQVDYRHFYLLADLMCHTVFFAVIRARFWV